MRDPRQPCSGRMLDGTTSTIKEERVQSPQVVSPILSPRLIYAAAFDSGSAKLEQCNGVVAVMATLGFIDPHFLKGGHSFLVRIEPEKSVP